VNDREILRVLGRNIRQARLKAGLTQECLSELSGVHVQTIESVARRLALAGPGTDRPHQEGSCPQTRSPENRVGRFLWALSGFGRRLGTREVERRRRGGELGALGAVAQRREASRQRKPATTAAQFIASVTSTRFAQRNGRGREGERADRKPVERANRVLVTADVNFDKTNSGWASLSVRRYAGLSPHLLDGIDFRSIPRSCLQAPKGIQSRFARCLSLWPLSKVG
jgi:hypothetical protein